jgi:hypothetical protein
MSRPSVADALPRLRALGDPRPACSCGKPFPEDGGAEGVCECCSTCTAAAPAREEEGTPTAVETLRWLLCMDPARMPADYQDGFAIAKPDAGGVWLVVCEGVPITEGRSVTYVTCTGSEHRHGVETLCICECHRVGSEQGVYRMLGGQP